MWAAIRSMDNWMLWSIGLIVGFPLIIIVLGEVVGWLQRKESPFAKPFRVTRHWLLPLIAAWLLGGYVIGLPDHSFLLRMIETGAGMLGIYVSLALINVMLFDIAEPGSWQRQVPKLLRDLAQSILVLVGFAIVMSEVWDANLGGLLTALGVGSIVIGLALQDTLSNVFAGIAMLIERPFVVGDWIQAGTTIGKVTEINWRAVHLETGRKQLIVIPNGIIAKGELMNFSQPTPVHRERIEISFSYDDPPNRVKEAMVETMLSVHGVLSDPGPYVETFGYNDSSILYRLSFFVDDYARTPRIRDQIRTRIWYATQRHGLTMPYPIHVQMSADDMPAVAREAKSAKIERVMRELPAVNQVETLELQQVATQPTTCDFARGEVILNFGDPLPGVYLILSGRVTVAARDAEGIATEMEQLTAGAFFAERSLIPGERNDSRVTALTDTEIAVLAPATLDRIFALAPRLSKHMGDVMQQRRKANAAQGAVRRLV
jgi:small-conductance mechanosensitive channel